MKTNYNVGDRIIVYDLKTYKEKCSLYVGSSQKKRPKSSSYDKIITAAEKEPITILNVRDEYVEVSGYWKIYYPGIKDKITKETHPEYYLWKQTIKQMIE